MWIKTNSINFLFLCVDEGKTVMCSDCIERKSSECEVRDTVFHNCVSDKVKIISNVDIASAFIVSGYGDTISCIITELNNPMLFFVYMVLRATSAKRSVRGIQLRNIRYVQQKF